MNNHNFKRLLFKTGFCCMACDGHIDEREVEILKSINKEEAFVAEESVQAEVNLLIDEVNTLGNKFLIDFITELRATILSEEEELAILNTAVRTIHADDNIEYSEISFFKLLRASLKVSDAKILERIPGIEEYLQKDVLSKHYSRGATSHLFETPSLPKFEFVQLL